MIKTLYSLLLTATLTLYNCADASNNKNQININDQASLQRGARIFTQNCLSCHSASAMRFNHLTDIGLTEAEIKKNLMFDQGKISDPMLSAMSKDNAKIWFGNPPPDLSLIAHSRDIDYLYAYLTGFYHDTSRPLNWNNTALPNTTMPHVLWEYQGVWALAHDTKNNNALKQKQITVGKLTEAQYHAMVEDTVNYLVYMGEPSQTERKKTGWKVLLFLALIMLPLTYSLKKAYWKDIH